MPRCSVIQISHIDMKLAPSKCYCIHFFNMLESDSHIIGDWEVQNWVQEMVKPRNNDQTQDGGGCGYKVNFISRVFNFLYSNTKLRKPWRDFLVKDC